MSIAHNIKVLNKFEKESFYCNICTYPLLTFKDFESQKEYKCCNDCFMQFAESRKQEWKNGWRPEKTDVRDYILLKKKNNIRSNNEFKF